MKTYHLESWISLHRLTPGRRTYALRKLKAALAGAGLTAQDQDWIAAQCDAIIAKELTLLGLQREWQSGRAFAEREWSPEILALDAALDRTIVQLRDLLAALAPVEDSPRGVAAKKLLDAHFAQGPTYYTQQIIEEEVVRVGELLGTLDTQGADVAAASVDELVARIKAIYADYESAVHNTPAPQRTAFASVKDANLANQRALLGVVTAVLAATQRMPDPLPARAALLSVVAEQDAEVGAIIVARRKVEDVDPDSGAAVTAPTA